MNASIDEQDNGEANSRTEAHVDPELTIKEEENATIGSRASSESINSERPTHQLKLWVLEWVLERWWAATLTVISALVATAATAYSLEHPNSYTAWAEVLDFVLAVHVSVELGLRLLTNFSSPKRFFVAPLNWADGVVVTYAWGRSLRASRIPRLLRLLRAAHVSFLHQSKGSNSQLAVGLTAAAWATSFACLGLVVVGAAAAGLAVRYFGDNDPAAFGDHSTAVLSLIPMLLARNGWSAAAATARDGCDAHWSSSVYDGSITLDDEEVYVQTAWGRFRGVTCHTPTTSQSLLTSPYGLPEIFFGVLPAINLATVAFVVAAVASAMLDNEKETVKRVKTALSGAAELSPALSALLVAVCADGAIPATAATSKVRRRNFTARIAGRVEATTVFRIGSASLSFLAAVVAATGQVLLDRASDNDNDNDNGSNSGSDSDGSTAILRTVCSILRQVVIGACGLELLVRWLAGARIIRLGYNGHSACGGCIACRCKCLCGGGSIGLSSFCWDAGIVAAAVAAELLAPPSLLLVVLPALLALLRLPRCLSSVMLWLAPAAQGSPLVAAAGALFPFGSPSSAAVWVLEVGLMCGLSVLACSVFGATDPYHFGSLRRAAVSTWQMQTCDDWPVVLRASALGCNNAFSEGAYPVGYYDGDGENIDGYNGDGDSEEGFFGCSANAPEGAGFGAALFAAAASLIGGLALPSVLVGLASVAYLRAGRRQEADVAAIQRLERAMATLAEMEAEAGVRTSSSLSEVHEDDEEVFKGWWSALRQELAHEVFTALGLSGSCSRCCCTFNHYSISGSSSSSTVVALERLLPVIDFILAELPSPQSSNGGAVTGMSEREKQLLQGRGLKGQWSWADFAGFLLEWRLVAIQEELDYLKKTASNKPRNGDGASNSVEGGGVKAPSNSDSTNAKEDAGNLQSDHSLPPLSSSTVEKGIVQDGSSGGNNINGLSQADLESVVQRTVAAVLQDRKSAGLPEEPHRLAVTTADAASCSTSSQQAESEPRVATAALQKGDAEREAEAAVAASNARVQVLEAKAAALEAQLAKITSSLNSEQQRLEEVRGKSLDTRLFTVVTAEEEEDDSEQPIGRGANGAAAKHALAQRAGLNAETAPVESPDPSVMAWRTLLANARNGEEEKQEGRTKLGLGNSGGFNEAWAKDVEMVFTAFEGSSSSSATGNKSGGIPIKDLVKGLKALGVKLSPPQAVAFGESLDEDGDGTISLKEFMAAARWEMKKLETVSSMTSSSSSNVNHNNLHREGQSATPALSAGPRGSDRSPHMTVKRRDSDTAAELRITSESMPRSGDPASNYEVRRLRARSDALRARQQINHPQQQPHQLAPSAVPPWVGPASPKKSTSAGSGLSSMKFEERALPLPKSGSGRSGGSTSSTARTSSPRRLMPGERRGSKGSAAEASASTTTSALASPGAKSSASSKASKWSPGAKFSGTEKGSKLTPVKTSNSSAGFKAKSTSSPCATTNNNSQSSSSKFKGKGTATAMRSPTGRNPSSSSR